jgi:hypothetical protein
VNAGAGDDPPLVRLFRPLEALEKCRVNPFGHRGVCHSSKAVQMRVELVRDDLVVGFEHEDRCARVSALDRPVAESAALFNPQYRWFFF